MSINQTDAKAILDKVLSIDTRIWAVSIIKSNGNILGAKSKPSFKGTFPSLVAIDFSYVKARLACVTLGSIVIVWY